MTKATSWFWNRTLPSASTICTSPASVGIQARLTVFSVSAVITATTPGTAAAFVVSIFLTRAWRVRRAVEFAVEHAGQLDVVDVIALALGEADVLDALALTAHAFEFFGAFGGGGGHVVHSAASWNGTPLSLAAAN